MEEGVKFMIPKREYDIDVVFCLDLTGGAHYLLDQFKNSCLNIFDGIGSAFEEFDRSIRNFRVRIVGFRDFIDDEALLETEFFTLPEQTEEFMRVVDSLEACGGGDCPENGLEALALAIKSPWTANEGLKRHVICVITDAPALDFNARVVCPNYPVGMPKDTNELYEWYHTGVGTLDNRAKRLVLLAPKDYNWSEIGETWDNCCHIPVSTNSDIEEIFDRIGDIIRS